MATLPPPIIVQTRPGYDIWEYENAWKHKLSDCCADNETCCYVCWCCSCASYRMYKRTGEGCLSCCWPMTLWSLRTKMRTLFRIRGSLCGDCVAIHCCGTCALTQMYREMELHGL